MTSTRRAGFRTSASPGRGSAARRRAFRPGEAVDRGDASVLLSQLLSSVTRDRHNTLIVSPLTTVLREGQGIRTLSDAASPCGVVAVDRL